VHIVVLMPVFNDWTPAQEMVLRLDAVFATRTESLTIWLVDDGSTESPPPDFAPGRYVKIHSVNILTLKRNLGHQRALAIGLCHISARVPCDAVMVMDSDGQDDPADAGRLVDHLRAPSSSPTPIVFAERTRRVESAAFRFGYFGYRVLHYLLTGYRIRFGNFSVIPHSRLVALTADSRLWSHYAASVVGGKLPFTSVRAGRARRISGKSHLNAISLVTHGLSALSCYNEIIGVRLVVISGVLLAVSVLGVLFTLGLGLFTHLALPGWTSLFAGLLIIFLLQVITLVSIFTMQIIGGRSFQPVLPIRDYTWYVDRVKRYYPREA
jgi:polyisoprenyl-phosphate glycosyltransferase